MKRRDFVAALSFLTDERQLTQVMDGQGRKLTTVSEAEYLLNVIGVRIPIRNSVALRFA